MKRYFDQVDIARLDYYINHPEDTTVHFWGDGWSGWNALYDAIDEMSAYIKKSHVFVDYKEKYGTFRFYLLGTYDGTLKSILQPTCRTDFDWWYHGSWTYKHTPKLHKFIRHAVSPCVNKVLHYISVIDRKVSKLVPKRFIKWVVGKQMQILNEGFQIVALKHPEVVHEFISDVDCYEYIKPYGDYILDGAKIHNMHWKTVSTNP